MADRVIINGMQMKALNYAEAQTNESVEITFTGLYFWDKKDELLEALGKKPFDFENPEGKQLKLYSQRINYQGNQTGDEFEFSVKLNTFDPNKHFSHRDNITLEVIFQRMKFDVLIDMLDEKGIISKDEFYKRYFIVTEDEEYRYQIVKEILERKFPKGKKEHKEAKQ